MVVAVNTRFLLPGRLEGIGWFTYELTKRMVAAHPEHEFVFLFDRPWSEEFLFAENVRPVRVFPPARHPLLWWAWYEWAVPRALDRAGADVFLSPSGHLSLRAKQKTLMVLHDLAYRHFPENIPAWPRAYYQRMVPRFAQRAERIATVSEFCKRDFVEKLGVPADKIGVVHNACDDRFRPLAEAEQAIVRQRFAGGEPYFLYVGAIHPRKNLPRLLRAFEQFLDSHGGNAGVRLLLAGRVAWGAEEFRAAMAGFRYPGALTHLDYVPSAELPRLIASARALVYPSLFEGFGMPVLEAMQCGTPVLTSTAASLPEVAGSAALLVEPTDTAAMAAALGRLWHEPALLDQLREKGLARAAEFSWDLSAKQLWSELEMTMG
jgi:glycosyltransferase involved in cell wall biosynthesis